MEIKTRESMRTVKTFDRIAAFASKTRAGASEVKKYAEELKNNSYESETEYAGNTLQSTERRIGHGSLYGANKIGNWGIRETRKNIVKWRNRFKKATVNIRKSKKPPALPKPSAKITAKATRNSAKTAAKATKQTVKTTAKAAKATVKAAQKAIKVAKVAAKASVKFIKIAVKATIAAVKAAVAAVKGIAAAIAAGGWVAVVIILFVCIVALIIGSIFGIFAPDPNNDNKFIIVQTVQAANAEYEKQIEAIKNQYDCDMCFVTGEPCEWSFAVAVYAVKMNKATDIVTFDEAKAEILKDVYRGLNRIDIHTEQIIQKETRPEIQPDGSIGFTEYEIVKTYLYINTTPLSIEQAAELYGFNAPQQEQLHELLSDKYKEMWDALLPQ